MTFSMGCGMRSEGEGSFNYRSRSHREPAPQGEERVRTGTHRLRWRVSLGPRKSRTSCHRRARSSRVANGRGYRVARKASPTIREAAARQSCTLLPMSSNIREPERIDPRLVAIYREMTTDQRLAAGFDATRLVRSRLEAHLGANEGWTPEQIRSEVARRFLRASR